MSHRCDLALEISQYGGAKWLPQSNDFTEIIYGPKGNKAVSMPNGVYIFGIGGVSQFLPTGKKEWKTGMNHSNIFCKPVLFCFLFSC